MLVAAWSVGGANTPVNVQAAVRVATFRVDVTPAIGSPLCGGVIAPVAAIDDPLWAKGIVLESAGVRYVLSAIDYCEIRNGSYDRVCARLAAGAGAAAEHVAVCCLHQHNAPIIDEDAQRLLDASPAPAALMDLSAWERDLAKLEAAARAATARLRTCDEVAVGHATVCQVASSRRVFDTAGKLHVRFSSTTDSALHELPEGNIDSQLRTLSFLSAGRPLVRLHFYATHPQSFYGDGRVTSDVPGLAREPLELSEGVPQIYFTGCAGDVTMGKYNDGSAQARVELTGRLAAAMRNSIAASRAMALDRVSWASAAASFECREDSPYTRADAEATLANPQAPVLSRLNAALVASFARRIKRPIAIPMLELGPARVLVLPGEPFVEFQQAAARLAPENFVAVAGYGDGGTGYLCTARAFAEGGYEPTASLVPPRSEQVVSQALVELLAPR